MNIPHFIIFEKNLIPNLKIHIITPKLYNCISGEKTAFSLMINLDAHAGEGYYAGLDLPGP